MIPAISPNSLTSFRETNKKGDNKNPVSKGGERALALKATAAAGLGVGAEALWYLFDDGFVFEDIWDFGKSRVIKREEAKRKAEVGEKANKLTDIKPIKKKQILLDGLEPLDIPDLSEFDSKNFNIGVKDEKFIKNKQLKFIGAFLAIAGGFVAAVAAIYTLYKAPNIEYKAKVNSFVKGKDMDVYIKGNEVETELYDQMNEKAQNATEEEKVKLREQYLKLRAAKNQLPEWVYENK